MKAISSTLILLIAFLSALSIGCSSSRGRVASRQHVPVSGELAQSGDLLTSEHSTLSPSDKTESLVVSHSVETVAYRDDQAIEELTANAESDAIDDVPLAVPSDADADWTLEPLVPGGMTLESLEQLAMQNNPSIQQVSAAASRAAGIRTQVGLKPNPTIGYFGQEIGNEGAGGQHGAFVSQMFVRGDKLAWNQQVIGHDVNAVMWQVETQRQRVRTDIRVSFYEALAAQNRLQLARDFREIAEKGVRISEQRVAGKLGTRPDVLQSEIQLSEVDLAIQQAEFDFIAAWKELAAVVGLPDLAVTTLIGELDVLAVDRDADFAYSQIVSESPLLASAMARVDRARANMHRQNIQPIPNVTAQLGVGYDDSTGDDYANVQLSLPLPIHNKNQGNIRAAQATYCEATQNVQRLRMLIRRDLARVMREYQVAQATVRQYESAILPKAEETLELMQEAQLAGEFDFLRVLIARRAYFDVNLKYVTALGALAQADAKIDGLLLTGGLSNVATYTGRANLRGQALSGQ